MMATAVGNCYEAAVEYCVEHGTLTGRDGNPDLIIVHAEITGQGPIEGVRHGHAWVEDGDVCIDVSNGKNLRMPKILYYGLAKVYPPFPPYKPNMHRYTQKEAAIQLVKHRHYGPWDLVTSTGR